MFSLQYRGRIYKSKFSMRSFRYILSDQAARAFPALQRQWLFPVESRPIAEAAVEHVATPSASIGAPVPECLVKLGIPLPRPLQATQHFYRLQDTVITGWAGAMMKDGLLLADGPTPNWASHIRARWHRLRTLPAGRPYYNLMSPIPARAHIFHWLFESVVPLLAFLEKEGRDLELGADRQCEAQRDSAGNAGLPESPIRTRDAGAARRRRCRPGAGALGGGFRAAKPAGPQAAAGNGDA